MIGIFYGLGQDVPRNAGSYRRVAGAGPRRLLRRRAAPPGLVLALDHQPRDRVGNATQRALAELGDGFGLAERGTIVPASMAVISGRDPRRQQAPFVNSLFLMHTGGAGGRGPTPGSRPATSATSGSATSTASRWTSCTTRSASRALPADRHRRRRALPRGALGPRRVRARSTTSLVAWFASDGTRNAPAGVRGGLAGGRAAQFRRGADGALVPVTAFGGVTLAPGESLVAVCCGRRRLRPALRARPGAGPERRSRGLGLAPTRRGGLWRGPRRCRRARPAGDRCRPRPARRSARSSTPGLSAHKCVLRSLEPADQGPGFLPGCDIGRKPAIRRFSHSKQFFGHFILQTR